MSLLSRILKKEAKELKNYCTELGLKLEPCKTMDHETEKEFDDTQAILKSTHKAVKKEKAESQE